MEEIYVVLGAIGIICLLSLFWLYVISKKREGKRDNTDTGKIIAKCGHPTYITGKVSAFGESTATTMPVHADRSIDYCLDCLGKMAILCAWCKKPIFIGDPITLFNGAPQEMPEHSVVHNGKPVGCSRPSCGADTGADYAGVWLPGEDGKGRVHKHPSMYEQASAEGFSYKEHV